MNYKLDKGAHSVYSLQYHFVQCVKYRKQIFVDERYVDFMKNQIYKISETFEVEVINIEFDKDHFHMLFKGKPTLVIPKYINAIKTHTSREIRRNFPEILQELCGGAFWSRSYFLATTGQVTLEILNKYVDGQKAKRKS